MVGSGFRTICSSLSLYHSLSTSVKPCCVQYWTSAVCTEACLNRIVIDGPYRCFCRAVILFVHIRVKTDAIKELYMTVVGRHIFSVWINCGGGRAVLMSCKCQMDSWPQYTVKMWSSSESDTDMVSERHKWCLMLYQTAERVGCSIRYSFYEQPGGCVLVWSQCWLCGLKEE